jgi:hypothetical protein
MTNNLFLDELLNGSMKKTKFKKEFEKDCIDLDSSVAIIKVREDVGLTQAMVETMKIVVS